MQFDPLPPTQTVLRLYLPSDKKPEEERSLAFTSMHVKRVIRNKKKLTVTLTNDHELNKQKLLLIQADAQRLQYYHDTTIVLKVNFSPDATYGEFAGLLNILTKARISRYALIDDSMIFGTAGE
jgi:biopolymer transport protein ExbD